MKIELTPREETSLEYNLEKIKATPDVILDFETSYNFKGITKEQGSIVLFKITYYLIFTDVRSNEQVLHCIVDFGCRIINDGGSYENDQTHLWHTLEFVYNELWEGLRERIPYLKQKVLNKPYVNLEFPNKMMDALKSSDFYK